MHQIKPILAGVLCTICLLSPALSQAMEFRIFFQPELKLNVVVGEGEIKNGDADRFLSIAKLAHRDREGHVILVLDSPGGSVQAAFQLVAAMDKVGVFTIVPDNAKCASACASVVFASGIRRDVVGTGVLGFHSCYQSDGRTVTESSLCNEVIAENAIRRGLAHASVSLFVDEYGARKMAWVGRDVACTMLPGLCRPTLITTQESAHGSSGPSFECKMAKSVQENLICRDSELAKLDNEMANAYAQRRRSAQAPQELKTEQLAWLRYSRNVCDDKDCLIRSYKLRIKELAKPVQ